MTSADDTPADTGASGETPAEGGAGKPGRRPREPRGAVERVFVRVVATIGIIGIGVGLGAILSSNKVQGWVIGLVVALVTYVLTGLLRSTRQLKPPPRR